MAAELSNEELFEIMEDLRGRATAQLVGKFAPDVSQSDRQTLVLEFERGRAHIFFVLVAKLTHFAYDPYSCFRLGHLDEDVGRAACTRLLQSQCRHSRVSRS